MASKHCLYYEYNPVFILSFIWLSLFIVSLIFSPLDEFSIFPYTYSFLNLFFFSSFGFLFNSKLRRKIHIFEGERFRSCYYDIFSLILFCLQLIILSEILIFYINYNGDNFILFHLREAYLDGESPFIYSENFFLGKVYTLSIALSVINFFNSPSRFFVVKLIDIFIVLNALLIGISEGARFPLIYVSVIFLFVFLLQGQFYRAFKFLFIILFFLFLSGYYMRNANSFGLFASLFETVFAYIIGPSLAFYNNFSLVEDIHPASNVLTDLFSLFSSNYVFHPSQSFVEYSLGSTNVFTGFSVYYYYFDIFTFLVFIIVGSVVGYLSRLRALSNSLFLFSISVFLHANIFMSIIFHDYFFNNYHVILYTSLIFFLHWLLRLYFSCSRAEGCL